MILGSRNCNCMVFILSNKCLSLLPYHQGFCLYILTPWPQDFPRKTFKESISKKFQYILPLLSLSVTLLVKNPLAWTLGNIMILVSSVAIGICCCDKFCLTVVLASVVQAADYGTVRYVPAATGHL